MKLIRKPTFLLLPLVIIASSQVVLAQAGPAKPVKKTSAEYRCDSSSSGECAFLLYSSTCTAGPLKNGYPSLLCTNEFVAEFSLKVGESSDKPVRERCLAATECSATDRGGPIVATSGLYIIGGRVALVGDLVRYPEGGATRIASGAGAAMVCAGRALAVVGSELDNGDRIVGPMHNGIMIVQYVDEAPIRGLLDPNYVPAQANGGRS